MARNTAIRLPQQTPPSEAALSPPESVVIRELDLDVDEEDQRPTNPPPPPSPASQDLLRTRPRRGPARPEAGLRPPRSEHPVNERPAAVALELGGQPLFTEEAAFARPRPPSVPAPGASHAGARHRWLPWVVTGALVLAGAIGWSVTQNKASASAHDRPAPTHAQAR